MSTPYDSSDLGYHLHHAFTALVGRLNQALRAEGIPLNHSQFSVLQVLGRSDAQTLSQRRIALELGRDPAAVSRTLDYLERHGFVERVHVSGCRNSVALTPKAEVLRPKLACAIESTVGRACAGMSAEEYAAGISFLTKIYEHASE